MEIFVFILRLFLACVCGVLIGFERMHRAKEAGMRTHCLVACGSALMVIVSKYGFLEGDTSRIAAQIVSGIGFLGAGMIFVHKKSIKGLTTAAGIWTTAGVGMAAGAGMYALCIVTTLIVVSILKITEHHKKIHEQTLIIDGVTEENFSAKVHEKLEGMDISVEDLCVSSKSGKRRYEFIISIPKDISIESITALFEYDCVIRVNY